MGAWEEREQDRGDGGSQGGSSPFHQELRR
jgi:hypothetical protein